MPTSTKPFSVYHWDTFDNETFLLGKFATVEEAVVFIEERYAGRLRSNGADRVEIVKDKRIQRRFSVG